MTEQEIRQLIFQLLKKIAPDTEPEKLQPDDDIRHTLEIDSFDYLQFIVAIDEQLELDIPEEDYGKIDTVKNMTNYIISKKTKKV
ncbi:acyl carrier protein [Segetibacter koreensis]|uniref:acyl carrier protein n=1 Tax=Segetibacter koreensis TaxID=398037 RepID=UPI0003819FB4|nr:phosphopantetheine-binding protein [Segetibacter koreensis]